MLYGSLHVFRLDIFYHDDPKRAVWEFTRFAHTHELFASVLCHDSDIMMRGRNDDQPDEHCLGPQERIQTKQNMCCASKLAHCRWDRDPQTKARAARLDIRYLGQLQGPSLSRTKCCDQPHLSLAASFLARGSSNIFDTVGIAAPLDAR